MSPEGPKIIKKIDSFHRKWVRTSDRRTRIQVLTGVLVGVRVQSSLGIGQEIFSYFGNGFGHEKIKTWDSDMDSDTITRRLFDRKMYAAICRLQLRTRTRIRTCVFTDLWSAPDLLTSNVDLLSLLYGPYPVLSEKNCCIWI